jgi:protein-tyrosine phosphatase
MESHSNDRNGVASGSSANSAFQSAARESMSRIRAARICYNLTLPPVIDLHCHILPGIDDGPSVIEGSLMLARAAESAGIATIVATPHVNSEYPNRATTIAGLVDEVGARFAVDDIKIDVRAGAEIAMTTASELTAEELSELTLGGGPWLLIESPFTTLATGFDMLLLQLLGQGHRVVLAHPERSPFFHRDPEILGSLARNGVLMSITAGSLAGQFGNRVRRFALRLAGEELVHNVTSDAHDHQRRPPGMRAAIEDCELRPLADWLTRGVPEAVLGGGEIPARPAVPAVARKSGRWWPFRRAS